MEPITREKMIELLNMAACPAIFGTGVIVRDELHGEIEQCQFCYERDQAIAALQAAEPVAEVVHNSVGVDIAWCFPPSSGRPPAGTKLFTLSCPPAKAQAPDVDALAQFIRYIDGDHKMGAGALAEKIVEWLTASPETKEQAPDYKVSACYFPKAGEIEITYEQQFEPYKTCHLTLPVTPEQGSSLAEVIDPCVYHSASPAPDHSGDELVRDAGRYRWLRNRRHSDIEVIGPHGDEDEQFLYEEELDEAIDAQRQQEEAER